MTLTVGCDPEFFLFDTKKKMYVSAHNMVPGDKQNPHKLDKGAVQVDGTAVEFNIEPATTAAMFENHVVSVLKQVREMIPSRYEFRFEPAVKYPANYFESLPDYTKVLGCDPDYSAVKDGAIIERDASAFPGLRTGSGHIHVGWTKGVDPYDAGHFQDCMKYSRVFSSYWGVLKHKIDTDTERQNLYGAYSPFRPKSYGVEVRAPSNTWLKHRVNYGNVFNFAVQIDNILTGKYYNYSFLIGHGWKA